MFITGGHTFSGKGREVFADVMLMLCDGGLHIGCLGGELHTILKDEFMISFVRKLLEHSSKYLRHSKRLFETSKPI